MSASGKRLDLRFGVFACSVQGFDDPVQPVQQILRAIQHLLEETPELADAGINFDAETIERLIGEVAQRAEIDEDQVEIVPGLVMIHHAGGGELAGRGDAPGAASDAAEDYVNIFTATRGGETATGAEREDLAAHMDRMAEEPGGNGADYGWDETEEDSAPDAHVFALADERGDHAAREPAEDEAAPSNLFSGEAAGEADETGTGAAHNLFAEPGEEEADEAYTHARSADGADWDDALELTGGQKPAGEAPAGDVSAEDAAAEAGADDGYTAASLAERAGAKTVPDLMVCAAAWMALIQGSTQFKRRDVLDVFEKLPGDHDKSLEAQIKGFGKAVRNGHLVMVGDGVFGLARDDLEWFQKLL